MCNRYVVLQISYWIFRTVIQPVVPLDGYNNSNNNKQQHRKNTNNTNNNNKRKHSREKYTHTAMNVCMPRRNLSICERRENTRAPHRAFLHFCSCLISIQCECVCYCLLFVSFNSANFPISSKLSHRIVCCACTCRTRWRSLVCVFFHYELWVCIFRSFAFALSVSHSPFEFLLVHSLTPSPSHSFTLAFSFARYPSKHGYVASLSVRFVGMFVYISLLSFSPWENCVRLIYL